MVSPNFMIVRLTSDNKNLSFAIFKHPETIYERQIRNGTKIIGKWIGNCFQLEVSNDREAMRKHCHENNTSYNDSVFWLPGPYNLVAFKECFRTAFNQAATEKFSYTLIVTPALNVDYAKFLGSDIEATFAGEGNVGVVFFTGTVYLDEFLKKVYVALFETHKQYTINKISQSQGEVVTRFKGNEETITPAERKQTLHTKRHDKVREIMSFFSIETVLDICGGDGRMWDDEKVLSVTVLEATEKVKYINKRHRRIRTNVLYPLIPNYKPVDCALLVECLEHFSLTERKRLYTLLETFYQPNKIILTTPNVEYNKVWGLEGYRHKDHKVEFTKKQLEDELSEFLPNYRYAFFDFSDETGQEPSFIVLLYRLIEQTEPKDELVEALFANQAREINAGLCNRAVLTNGENIFYLGYTISPAKSDGIVVESVEEGSKLFPNPIYEKKYMGSRAYILFFNSLQEAKRYGYDKTLIINSRSGYEFFYKPEDKPVLEKIYNELLSTGCTSLMLDCEIIPWVLTGRGLIEWEFYVPIKSELLHHALLAHTEEAFNCLNALDILEKHGKDTPLEIRVFDYLMFNGDNVTEINRVIKHVFLDTLLTNTTLLKPVEWSRTPLNLEWYDEGLVIKPDSKQSLPAIKARNPEFLRLILGTQYDVADFSHRNTSRKMKQSETQYQLSIGMVEAMLSQNRVKLLRNIGLFFSGANEEDVTL